MSWELTWLMKVAPKLVDLDDLWRPTMMEVKDVVMRLEISEMNPRCLEQTLEPLRDTAAWEIEDILVSKAIESLMVEEIDLGFSADGDECMY